MSECFAVANADLFFVWYQAMKADLILKFVFIDVWLTVSGRVLINAFLHVRMHYGAGFFTSDPRNSACRCVWNNGEAASRSSAG